MKKIQLAAHRGFSECYPENTMIAFREALKLDIDMVETDVHMTRDGVLVLMHDHDLARTTDKQGLIREMDFAEVEKADAGIHKGEQFKGEKVPTLREFLELVKDRKDIELNIELKDYPGECGAFAYESCDKTIAMLDEYGVTDRCYINSFSGDILNYVYTKYENRIRLHGYFPVRLLGEYFSDNFFKRCACVCLFNVSYDENGKSDWSKNNIVCEQSKFDLVKSYGAQPWCYFKVDEEDKIKTALERGAVAFTSNNPVKAAEILKKLGAR